jgi:hypothetical protein
VTARLSASSLGLQQLIGLAIGPDGNLYVTDTRPSVTVISPHGKVLRSWGKAGHRPGEFDFSLDQSGNLHASIVVGSDSKVYVSDPGNHRVEVFSGSGTFIREFGEPGLGDGQFVSNWTLAVDGQGNVYVADDTLQTLSKFSPEGRFEWSIDGTGSTDPDLVGNFMTEGVDAHGRVVVGVDGSHRIVYLDGQGHEVDSIDTGGLFTNDWGPCDVTSSPDGFVVAQSCPDAGHAIPNVPAYTATLLFDRTHRLIGAWHDGPFSDFVTVRFGPNGEAFALEADPADGSPAGSILEVKVATPDA